MIMAYLISNPQFNIWNISYISLQLILLLHCSRDCRHEIRALCIAEMGEWMKEYRWSFDWQRLIYGWMVLSVLWWSSVRGSASKTLKKLYISRLCRKGLSFILGRRLSGMKNDWTNEYVWFFVCTHQLLLSLRDIVNVCMKAIIIIIVHSARKTDQYNSHTCTTVKIIINSWERAGAIRLVELGNYCRGRSYLSQPCKQPPLKLLSHCYNQHYVLTHLIVTRIWLWAREKLSLGVAKWPWLVIAQQGNKHTATKRISQQNSGCPLTSIVETLTLLNLSFHFATFS